MGSIHESWTMIHIWYENWHKKNNFRLENFGSLGMKRMYFHLKIQFSVAGVSMTVVPFCKKPVLSTSELYAPNTRFSRLDSLRLFDSEFESKKAIPWKKKYNKIAFIFEATCRRYQLMILRIHHVMFNFSGIGPIYKNYIGSHIKFSGVILSRIRRFFSENGVKWLRRLWFYQFVGFKLIRCNLLDRFNQLLLVYVCL